RPSPKKSRSGFAAFFFLSLLAACFVLRLVLFVKLGRDGADGLGHVAQAFLLGFHQDLAVALITTLPLLFCLWIIPDRWFSRPWCRIGFFLGFFIFWAVQV